MKRVDRILEDIENGGGEKESIGFVRVEKSGEAMEGGGVSVEKRRLRLRNGGERLELRRVPIVVSRERVGLIGMLNTDDVSPFRFH